MMLAVRTHGKPQKFLGLPEQAIPNQTDLTINHLGESASTEEHCEDISKRYGNKSHQYQNLIKVVEMLKGYKENIR